MEFLEKVEQSGKLHAYVDTLVGSYEGSRGGEVAAEVSD